MGLYQLKPKAGTHQVADGAGGFIIYSAGEVVESDVNLVKSFPGKFVRVDVPIPGTKVKPNIAVPHRFIRPPEPKPEIPVEDERTFVENISSDAKPESADTPDADTPDADTADADTADADTPDADTSDADTPDADTPDADTADADTPDADTAAESEVVIDDDAKVSEN